MILNSKPLSIVEAAHYVKKSEENKVMNDYTKAFGNASFEQAKKIREKLTSMNNPKIRETAIVKVIDILPKDAEEVHKIFNDVSLTEEEVSSVLSVVKE